MNPNITEEIEKKLGMKMNSTAGAGRGRKIPPTGEQMRMIQEMEDEKMAPKLEDAYNQSLTDTEMPKSMGKSSGGYANGGYVRAADGCAKRGKTRGKMV
jgi:hypothetical protein